VKVDRDRQVDTVVMEVLDRVPLSILIMATRKKNTKKSLTGFHQSISFYDRQIFHRCGRRGQVNGCLHILSLKNGNLVLEAPFGAMEFVCILSPS
jgi:hypothetical protein